LILHGSVSSPIAFLKSNSSNDKVILNGGPHVTLFKYRLSNGNVLIWLGTGEGWKTSQGIDNVLVTHGGQVLILRTVKVLSMMSAETKRDLETLDAEQFAGKHGVAIPRELLDDLKKGLHDGTYPPRPEPPQSETERRFRRADEA